MSIVISNSFGSRSVRKVDVKKCFGIGSLMTTEKFMKKYGAQYRQVMQNGSYSGKFAERLHYASGGVLNIYDDEEFERLKKSKVIFPPQKQARRILVSDTGWFITSEDFYEKYPSMGFDILSHFIGDTTVALWEGFSRGKFSELASYKIVNAFGEGVFKLKSGKYIKDNNIATNWVKTHEIKKGGKWGQN